MLAESDGAKVRCGRMSHPRNASLVCTAPCTFTLAMCRGASIVSFTCEEAVSVNRHYSTMHKPALRGATVGSRTRRVAYAVDAPHAKHGVSRRRPGLVRGQRVALLTAVAVAANLPSSVQSIVFVYLFIFHSTSEISNRGQLPQKSLLSSCKKI